MTLKVVSLFGVVMITLVMSACNSARGSKELQAATSQVSVRVRCEAQLTVLECRAFSDDVTLALATGGDITDRVRWTADTRAVVVRDGKVRADAGGTATVTASLADLPGAPSASVTVVADAASGDTRQVYVFEGEVRPFPAADAIAGAQVSLISDAGVARSVTTASHGEGRGRFRFTAVPRGAYRLRVVSDGYRVNEMRVVVPDDMPRTITLLAEPRSQSMN